MRNSALISAGLHVVIIASVYLGLPSLFRPEPAREVPIVVEILELGDEPLKKRPSKRADKAEPKAARRVASAPASRHATPTPPPPPQPVLRSPPAVPLPMAKPKPKKEKLPPVPRRKPKFASVAPAPKPKRKPQPPPDAFDVLLKNLSKDAQKNRPAESKETVKETPITADPLLAARTEPPPENSIDHRRLVGTLAQMVISQITPCWSIPVGAKEAEEMQIGVTIVLNPDGTLRGPPRIEDRTRMARDLVFRAVAESALRALYHPRCTPLRLPVKNYETWKEISFNFDPREALGQ